MRFSSMLSIEVSFWFRSPTSLSAVAKFKLRAAAAEVMPERKSDSIVISVSFSKPSVSLRVLISRAISAVRREVISK